MLSFLNSKIIGPVLPFILGGVSVYLLIKLSFKPFKRPMKMIKALTGGDKKEAFKSVCLSLSGTLGVGNIAGVAAAIAVGGAGSVFWMWIFALFAMVIKYAEVVIAMRYKSYGNGGAALYIKHGLNCKWGSVLFSLLIIISSIVMGNTVQSSAAAQSMKSCFGIPTIVTGLLFALVTLIMISGGRKRISQISSLLIPLLSLAYVLISLSIIIVNRSLIPNVLSQIVTGALGISPVAGGALGFTFTEGLRLGASRGILSNEAGCGTAAYAHMSECHAAEQGIFGIFEVFFDTILLCTLTAFVVLISPLSIEGSNGMALALDAYGQYGKWIKDFIGISAAVYALASVVCWSYYGISALKYLSANKNSRRLYLTVYSLTGIVGAVFAPSIVWEISDLTVAVMAIFNTLCVGRLWREVKSSTEEYFV